MSHGCLSMASLCMRSVSFSLLWLPTNKPVHNHRLYTSLPWLNAVVNYSWPMTMPMCHSQLCYWYMLWPWTVWAPFLSGCPNYWGIWIMSSLFEYIGFKSPILYLGWEDPRAYALHCWAPRFVWAERSFFWLQNWQWCRYDLAVILSLLGSNLNSQTTYRFSMIDCVWFAKTVIWIQLSILMLCETTCQLWTPLWSTL